MDYDVFSPEEIKPGARQSIGYLNVRVNEVLNDVHWQQQKETPKGKLKESIGYFISGAGFGALFIAIGSYTKKSPVSLGKLIAGTSLGSLILGGFNYAWLSDRKFGLNAKQSVFHLQQLNDARNLLDKAYGKEITEIPIGNDRYQEIKNDPLLTGPRISSCDMAYSDRDDRASREFAKKHMKRDPLVADGTAIGKSN